MVLPPARLALRVASALAAATLLLASIGPAPAQVPVDLGPHDPTVPTVAALRGFVTGETFSTYRDVERVVEGIAAASDRVVLETYGASAEGRPLRIAWVSSPANLDRLDALRAENRAALEGDAPVDRPIFVWLSFGVHGDEASSPEAALELLWNLAASRDPAVARWLEEAVIAVDPLLNPDGHERYVGWYRSVAGVAADPDPAAREHRPEWPGGRTNHWYFDLNRDWAWGVQPETRARRVAYLATLPQVHVDFHEMGVESTYFFFPPASPVHANYPESTERWGRTFGRANAAAFDARGWPYFTEEEYDLFYPGYGDSWPSFFGATGMTYEQAGGGRAGVAIERAPADTLTLLERVEHHLVAALTTIDTAVEHRVERLADFDAFWRSPARRSPGAPMAWIVSAASPDGWALAHLLAEQGVVVDTLATSLSTRGLTPYPATGADRISTLPPGTFLLRADQPLGRYLATLMSADVSLPDSTLFYDITGWSLPYLFDVPTWRADRAPAAGRWTATRDAPPAPPPSTDAVALAWPYRAVADVVAAGRLAADGWVVRVAGRGFTAAGLRFPPGSFVVRLDDQPAGRRDAAAAHGAATAAGARPLALGSSETDRGVDLGSERMRSIPAPRVALAAGPGTSVTSVGAAWHLLAAEARLPVDVVRLADLAAAPGTSRDSLSARESRPIDLHRYTAIVLPDGPGSDAYATALGEEGRARLAAWVDAGGTLVGFRGGAAWLSADGSGVAEFALAESPEPSAEELRAPAAVREAEATREKIPGTIVSAAVDTTHPLGWGYDDGRAAVLLREPVELALSDDANPWLYEDAEPLAGYLPAAARERLPGTPYAVVEARGEGHVVAFADDPAFRGILHGLKKAMLNAILLVPGP
ncbi:MAG: hypothetical protein KY397_06005 [Gemmatimonadetes bacterium]|nr:hypothetical protein [Gemmatimonadota bacterium]